MMNKTASSNAAASIRRNHYVPRALSERQKEVIRLRNLLKSAGRQKKAQTPAEAETIYRSAVYRLTHDEYVRGVRKLEDAAALGHEDAQFLLLYLSKENRNNHRRPCLAVSGFELARALEDEHRRREWARQEEEHRSRKFFNEVKIRLTALEYLLSDKELEEIRLAMENQKRRRAARLAQASKSAGNQNRKGRTKNRQNTAV